MKKIERLRWIEKNFGSKFVLKYFYCTNWDEIRKAIAYFRRNKQTWGLRTDSSGGYEQKDLAPFLFNGSYPEALKIWEKYQENLRYIVCRNIPKVFCHGVAKVISKKDRAVFFEYNDIEKNIAQRNMYDHPENLRHLYIAPQRWIPYNNDLIRCYSPKSSFVVVRSFHVVYGLFFENIGNVDVDEIVFTVLPNNKKIIIW